MADLLPTRPDVDEREGGDPRVLGVDSEDADDVIGALSAGTARDLLAALYEDPAAPSALAERVDTSLQNAQYHLQKLEDAGLIEERGTQYSAKGREMTVYGPADEPVVLFAGSDRETGAVRSALTRLLGAAALLGAASLLVQVLLEGGSGASGPGGGPGGSGGMTVQSTEAAGAAASALPPGALFFTGGALVLVALAAWRLTRG